MKNIIRVCYILFLGLVLFHCQSNQKNKSQNVSIIEEYKKGNSLVLKEISDKEINQKDSEGKTLLDYAIEKEDIQKVEELLQKGAIVYDSHIESAGTIGNGKILMLLVKSKNLNLIQLIEIFLKYKIQDFNLLMLENDQNLNILNESGNSILHETVNYRNLKMTKYLIEKFEGINLNIPNVNESTPLHLASEYGYQEFVELFLKNGAKPFVKNKNGNTPLHLASKSGNVEICRLLLEAETELLDEPNLDFITPLGFAVQYQKKEVAKFLIEKGANINITDIEGNSLLYWAAKNDYKDIVELLIRNGAKINIVEKDGWTVLAWAIEKNYPDIVDLLIDNGVDIFQRHQEQNTLLHWSAYWGYQQISEKLLKKGLNPNSPNQYLETPIHYIALNGNPNLGSLLIQNGGNTNYINFLSATPLHYASAKNNIEIMKLFIKNQANVNAKTEIGATPLHWAAANGNIEAIELLIQNNANVNEVDIFGNTPLLYAAMNSQKKVIELLLKNGSNINHQDIQRGWSALHWAAFRGDLDIAEILINNKINPKLKDKEKNTPLNVAATAGKTQIINFLKKFK